MTTAIEIQLGKIITDDTQKKDAIHIAVAPVIANEKLAPGQDIGFVKKGDTELVGVVPDGKAIGIVDPYLTTMVFPEQRFWLCLYPLTITGLRHDWNHPAFDPLTIPGDSSLGAQWMRQFASSHFAPYEGNREYTIEEMIVAGRNFLLKEDRMVQQGSTTLRDTTNAREFWKHYEAITGEKVPEEDRDEVPFCCNC